MRALIRHFAKVEVRFQGVHVGDRPDSKEGSETHVEIMSSWTSLQSPFLDPIFQLRDAKGTSRRRWGLLGGGVFEIVQLIQMQSIKGKRKARVLPGPRLPPTPSPAPLGLGRFPSHTSDHICWSLCQLQPASK